MGPMKPTGRNVRPRIVMTKLMIAVAIIGLLSAIALPALSLP